MQCEPQYNEDYACSTVSVNTIRIIMYVLHTILDGKLYSETFIILCVTGGSSRQDPATVPNAAYELHSTRSADSMEMNIAYDHHTPTATRPPLYEVVQ